MPAADPAPSSSPSGPGSSGTPPPAPRGTILIIDDDELVAKTIKRLLREQHDVQSERDPETAVARLVAGERFDAVLCELRLPKLSGIQVYTAIRGADRAKAERLVFMSGGVLDDDTEFFLQASQAQFLEKPFSIARLRAVVNGFVVRPSHAH
jgi:CheY-like chemotaxis protein